VSDRIGDHSSDKRGNIVRGRTLSVVRAGVRGRMIAAIAVLVIAQVPAQVMSFDGIAGPSPATAETRAPAMQCAAKPLVDPPHWEKSLPLAAVPTDGSATDPACVTEVGRSANGVVWRAPDGQLSARMYQQEVNYQASDGSWQPIDTRLVPDDKGGTVNRGGPFAVHFAGNAAASSLEHMEVPRGSVSFQFSGVATASGEVAPPSAQATGVVSGAGSDTLTYANALPGMDIQYRSLMQSVKEDIVLTRPLDPSTLPSMKFTLTTDGLTARAADDGSIEFTDSKGETAFAMAPGQAFDANGASTTVSYQLTSTADPNTSELVVSIVNEWLTDSARVFPVTIDPSLTVTDPQDAFIANSTADQNTNFSGWGQLDTTLVDFVNNAGVKSSEAYRSLMPFDVSPLAGSYIVAAHWHGYAEAVTGTTPVALSLFPITSSWNPSTVTWVGRPTESTSFATSTGYSGVGWQSADVTTFVRNWVSGTSSNFGFSVHGPSTGRVQLASALSITGNYPYLDVSYDAYPQASHETVGGQYTDSVVHAPHPTLSTQIDDSDTTSGLYVHYALYNSTKTTLLQSSNGTSVNSGERSTWTVPSALSDGIYYYLVTANDGTTTKSYSAWFPITVDTAAPNTPTGSLSGITANTWTTAGGAATANLGGNGSTDVQGFYWGLDQGSNPTHWQTATSNAASVSITPTWGWHDLTVRAVDKAGNLSASVSDFAFGWGVGGFALPTNDFVTQGSVTVNANGQATYDGVSLEWRHANSDITWNVVPVGDVTLGGSGIAGWPVTTTPGTYASAFPTLVWNAASTTAAASLTGDPDGPVQLRAAFYTAGVLQTHLTDTASIPNLIVDQFGFNSPATASAGPGQVNLATGDLSLGASDVAVPGGSVSRSFESLTPNASGGVFGPGWSSSLGGTSDFQKLTDKGDTVAVTTADASMLDFAKNPDGSYTAQADATDLTLTKVSGSRFTLSKDSTVYGFTNYDSNATPYFMPSDITDPTGATGATAWTVDATSGLTRPTKMVGPTPAGLFSSPYSCANPPSGFDPLTTEGCQTLTFSYATVTTATGTGSTQLGDYAGQLQTVHYTAWNPDLSTPAMQRVDVASYLYDNAGMLRAEWDPRISPALTTTYSYDSYGHVATVTPPGVQPFTFTYSPLSGEAASTGRLGAVSRPALPSGTATETIVYQVPRTHGGGGGGPYDMDATTVASWGQQDVPAIATAVFPPDQVPSSPPTSYTRATVYYMDSQLQTVNVAQPGGDITTTEYDVTGNVIRTLSAANRQAALSSSTSSTDQANDAALLDTQNRYDTNNNLIDSIGPAHAVQVPGGTTEQARGHTQAVYDENIPTDLTANAPFNLLTTQTVSAKPTDGSGDVDARTTINAYAYGADESGWTLGTPLQTTVDPGSGHLNLTTTTLYDPTTGQLSKRMLPANPSGGDAHETDFSYYTADTSAPDTACQSQPDWAGLPCKQAPAAQPGTSGLPNVKTTQVTAYNMYGQPETSVDTTAVTGGTVTRTTTIGYDAAGRETSQGISTTGSAGTSIPTTTTTYDTGTGLPYQTHTTSPSQTVTRSYDSLGRLISYTDADANTSTYTYDLLNRPGTVYDGKGTTTYTYDDYGTENRGLLTSVSDSLVGTFHATYNADGQLSTQIAPGGLTATTSYDPAGEPTNLKYSKGTGFWPSSPATYNIHGERVAMTSDLWIYNYTYDPAGRLTNTYEQNIFGCQNRLYAFDADTNRTALTTTVGVTWNSNPANCPPTTTGTTTNYSYDSADRITGTGYTYDSLGRTTAVSATDSPSGHATTLSYFTNDLVNTITSNSASLTYNLDPGRRVRTWISSADSQIHTNHYTGDTDSPAWTAETTGGSTWTRDLGAFAGLAATTNQAGTITLELINIHGDVVGPAATTDTTWNLSAAQTETDEYGRSSVGGAGSRYDYLGVAQRQRDTNSGLQLMGQRVYDPATGRFLQADPVSGGSANAYDYVAADPVNSIDVNGTTTCALVTGNCGTALAHMGYNGHKTWTSLDRTCGPGKTFCISGYWSWTSFDFWDYGNGFYVKDWISRTEYQGWQIIPTVSCIYTGDGIDCQEIDNAEHVDYRIDKVEIVEYDSEVFGNFLPRANWAFFYAYLFEHLGGIKFCIFCNKYPHL
jgi:RHS repeat-associated protein